MIYAFKPSTRYSASCYLDAPIKKNPDLEIGGWTGYFFGHYEVKDELLGQAINTPSYLRTTDTKATSDFFGPASMPLVVSERFKNLIEEFEPGVHEFLPFRLHNGSGRIWPGAFYLLRVRNWVSAIDVGLSKGLQWNRRPSKIVNDYYLFPEGIERKYVFNVDRVGSNHLWQHYPNFLNRLFCSQQFYEACKQRKLKYFDWLQCEVTHKAWKSEGNLAPKDEFDPNIADRYQRV
jgi:hypothetical protein